MSNQPIKLRNAITELWNEGQSVPTIAGLIGVSEERVKALLKSARNGYHTPAQEQEAQEALLARQQTPPVKRSRTFRKK